MSVMAGLKTLLWQHGVDGVIFRMVVVMLVGAVLIFAGLVSLALQFLTFPFGTLHAACWRLLRELKTP